MLDGFAAYALAFYAAGAVAKEPGAQQSKRPPLGL
jgi:hypothetical protein